MPSLSELLKQLHDIQNQIKVKKRLTRQGLVNNVRDHHEEYAIPF